MAGKAIGTSLNLGFPGTISRVGLLNVIHNVVASASENIAFGEPVVLEGDNEVTSPQTVTMTTANFGGFAVTNVMTNQTFVVGTNGQAGIYKAGDVLDRITVGTVSVTVVGTPAAGGTVYVRTALTSGNAEPIGTIRTTADGGNTIALPGCYFKTGYVDANNVTEVYINI